MGFRVVRQSDVVLHRDNVKVIGDNVTVHGNYVIIQGANGKIIGHDGKIKGPNGEIRGDHGEIHGPDGHIIGNHGHVYGANGRLTGDFGYANGPNCVILGKNGEVDGPRSEVLDRSKQLLHQVGGSITIRNTTGGSPVAIAGFVANGHIATLSDQNEPQLVTIPLPPPATTTTITAPIKEPVRKLQFREDGKDEKTKHEQVQCVVCMDNKKKVMYTPCNHLCVCFQCSRSIHARCDKRKCPVCTEAYEDRVQVFT